MTLSGPTRTRSDVGAAHRIARAQSLGDRARRGTAGRCRTRRGGCRSPAARRRAQASSFQAMSRSTSPTIARGPRHPAPSRATSRSPIVGVDRVEPARDLEGRLFAQDAVAVRLESLAPQRRGVEPDAVHVGVDQVRRHRRPWRRRARRGSGDSAQSASRKPAPTRRPSGRTRRRAHDALPRARPRWRSPSGCALSRERPLHDVHMVVPQPGDEPAAVGVEHPAAAPQRAGGRDVGDQAARRGGRRTGSSAEQVSRSRAGQPDVAMTSTDVAAAERHRAGHRACRGAAHLGGERRVRRTGPSAASSAMIVSTTSRGLVLAELALGDHLGRREPEPDRARARAARRRRGRSAPATAAGARGMPPSKRATSRSSTRRFSSGAEHLRDAGQVRRRRSSRSARSVASPYQPGEM